MSALKSHIDSNGKLAIPVKLRKMLNIKPGDQVEIKFADNKLIITSFHEKLAHARSLVKQYIKGSLVEELKIMRTEDANKE